MKHAYFESLEQKPNHTTLKLSEVIDQLAFNDDGLIPVITQDIETKEVLMFAWMNRQSLELTVKTKRMTYWSRSRKKLWIKGETSGNTQALISMSFDCDGDAVICKVHQSGGACHTGRKTCFYLLVNANGEEVTICP